MNNRNVIVLLLTCAIGLSGCSYLPPWMGGEKAEKEKLAGERIAVLPLNTESQPDQTLKDQPVLLPSVNANPDWPQHSGMFPAISANLGAAGAFTHIATANAGDGKSFEHTLVISPVVGGGKVFAMDAVGNISAHDAGNIGKVRWTSAGVSEEDRPDTMGGGLAYDQGRLYAVSGRGVVVALDAATGKAIWHKAMHIPFRCAPKVEDGRLFAITIDNQLYALNTADGNVLWTHRGINESAGLMNALSPAISGAVIVVPYSSGEIYVLSASDGKEVWSDSLSPGKRTQASALFAGIGGDPVVDGSVVFSVNSGGMISVQSLDNGQHVWAHPIGAINTPWIAGDYMFLLSADNTLLCFMKYDGRIRWATKLASFENEVQKKNPIMWKGPVLADGKLAVVSSNGKLLLVSATDGKITSTLSISDGIYTPPVIAGGRMYLVGQNATLYSLQ